MRGCMCQLGIASYLFRWYMKRHNAALALGAPPTRTSNNCSEGRKFSSLNCADAAPCTQPQRHTEMLNQVRSPDAVQPGFWLRITAT